MATTIARLTSQVPSGFWVPKPCEGSVTEMSSPLLSFRFLPFPSCAAKLLPLPKFVQSLPISGRLDRLLWKRVTFVTFGSTLPGSPLLPEREFGSSSLFEIGSPELSSMLGSIVFPSESWKGCGTLRFGLIANGGQEVSGLPSLSDRCEGLLYPMVTWFFKCLPTDFPLP